MAIEPVIEEYEIPLIYPTFYEGETPNDYVIYTGAVPNQQGDYFVPYLYENVSHNFYLIGTDTTYASAINEQAQALVEELGGTVIGNELVSSDTTEFSDILARIRDACGDEGWRNLCQPERGQRHSLLYPVLSGGPVGSVYDSFLYHG